MYIRSRKSCLHVLILKVHICTSCTCSHPSHSFTHPAHLPSPHTHHILHTATLTLSTHPSHSPHHHTHPLHTPLTFSIPPQPPSPHTPHILHTTTPTLSTHSSHSPHHHTHPLHKLFLFWGLPVGRNITIPADTTTLIYKQIFKEAAK